MARSGSFDLGQGLSLPLTSVSRLKLRRLCVALRAKAQLRMDRYCYTGEGTMYIDVQIDQNQIPTITT